MDVPEKKLYEGKTKIVWSDGPDSSTAVIETKPTITAHDNATLTREFEGKAAWSTATTCSVFALLDTASLPVAYGGQIDATRFRVERCRMIPLEVVARRYACGSYLKRHPDLQKAEGSALHRFDRLETEFFLKTTKGCYTDIMGDSHDLGLNTNPEAGQEDPLILDIRNPVEWQLWHSKRPTSAPDEITKKIAPLCNMEQIELMDTLVRRVFLVLEGAWGMMQHRLIDLKIEFGIDTDGNLLIADVVDNDSWRLRDSYGEELSKQVFRDDGLTQAVVKNYELVANLTEKFNSPSYQATAVAYMERQFAVEATNP